MAIAEHATGTDIQFATDPDFRVIVADNHGAYRVSQAFSKGSLPYGVNLYTRARHEHPDIGNTPWSPVVAFFIIVPANIVGVCLDNSGAKGVFYWIDAMGNKLPSFDLTQHPTFSGITKTTVDDARAPVSMTKVPLFYVKTATSGPVGSFADGKKCWWISDIMDTGFRPAACFKRSTALDNKGKYVISDACYFGTYMAHAETVGGAASLGSKVGQTVATGQAKSAFKTLISNRNNAAAGISGFRMFDIWDLSAIRILSLIAKANADSQTAWGDNTATAAPKTGATNARVILKGTAASPQVTIEDLWKCFFSYVDSITSSSGLISLTTPMNGSDAIDLSAVDAARKTHPVTSGWFGDVLDCPIVIGNDTHDMMELFMPKSVTAAETAATFADAFLQNDAAGELFCGFPFNYLETYQNYEQTGTTSHSALWIDAGRNSCPWFGGDDYWGTGCNANGFISCGDNCSMRQTCSSSICNQYTTVYTPVYGYVTRTRPKAYTTEPGLFALAKGVPFAAYNAAAYGCRICKN